MKKRNVSKDSSSLTIFEEGTGDYIEFESGIPSDTLSICATTDENKSTIEIDIESVPEIVKTLEKWYDDYKSKKILRYAAVLPTVNALLHTLVELNSRGFGKDKVLMFNDDTYEWQELGGIKYGKDGKVKLMRSLSKH